VVTPKFFGDKNIFGEGGSCLRSPLILLSDIVRVTHLYNLYIVLLYYTDMEFSGLESWSRDVSRPNFQSLGLGLEA